MQNNLRYMEEMGKLLTSPLFLLAPTLLPPRKAGLSSVKARPTAHTAKDEVQKVLDGERN